MLRTCLLTLALSLLAAGCGLPGGAGPTTCSNPTGGCVDDRSWRACCDQAECWYALSDGSDILCEGTDCSAGAPSAAELVVQWCTGS